MAFKRNQIEASFAEVLEAGDKPSPALRARLKRLLEADRAIPYTAEDVSEYAFFDTAPPGSGVEVWFSEFNAFALLTGIRLHLFGWPPRKVVPMLRRVRRQLLSEHRKILRQDRSRLFDTSKAAAKARPGDISHGSNDPVFLEVSYKENSSLDDEVMPLVRIAHGEADWFRDVKKGRLHLHATSFYELSASAWALKRALEKTTPLKRGRPPR